jgi:hypothetical protein
MLVWSIINRVSSVFGQVAAMTPSEAIHNLETYGRHMGNRFIAINHDKSVELLLKNAVIVLDDADMIERDTVKAWAHCNVRIINRDSEKVDFTT